MHIEELRVAVNAARQKMVEAHEAIERALTVEEGQEAPDTTELRAAFDAAEAGWKAASERFERASRLPQKIEAPEVDAGSVEASVAARQADVKVGKEASTYRPDVPVSFFRDMLKSQTGDFAASERLSRHAAEMRDLTTVATDGGELVAPLYLQSEFIDLARAGRVIANAIGSRPLPANTNTIVIPKMTGGVTVDVQSGDVENAAVSETDAVTSSVSAAVKTAAGMQDVAQQLLDRSDPSIDQIIYADLLAAYNVHLDGKVITSTATNSEGLLDADNANAVTYTATTPTAAGLYSKIADGIQQIHADTFMPADAIFMHPRRWAFLLAASDTSNRPLIVPVAQMPQNAIASYGGVIPEGLVGQLQGLPVFVDPNIPTTLGAGTNEDRVIVIRRAEHFLWEDATPRLETFRDVGSGTLTVRFRLFNYWAQQHERREGSLSILSGTGLAAPSF